MAGMEREFVRKVVFDEIRSLTRNNDLAISEDDPLIPATLMYGDDFANIFIIEIENRLRIRAPTREWSKVCTVGEAIDLLMRSGQYPLK
jgi:hypothetical protein